MVKNVVAAAATAHAGRNDASISRHDSYHRYWIIVNSGFAIVSQNAMWFHHDCAFELREPGRQVDEAEVDLQESQGDAGGDARRRAVEERTGRLGRPAVGVQ